MKTPKIIVYPLGGLANRIRSLASGVWLSRQLGVGLRVVWSVDNDLHAPFGQLFRMADTEIEFTQPSAFARWLLYMMPRRRNLYLSGVWQKLNYGLSLTDGGRLDSMLETPERVGELAKQAIARGRDVYFASCAEFYDFPAELLREIMIPTADIEARIDRNLEQTGRNVVGVQIRRTDHRVCIASSPTEGFIRRMHELLEQDPEVKFFLATDDEDEKRRIREEFPGRVVTNESVASRRSVDGMKDAVSDVMTLSRCKLILASRGSSFGQLAARFGGIKSEYP